MDLKFERAILREMSKVIMNRDYTLLDSYFIDSPQTKNDIYCDLQHNINNAFNIAIRQYDFKLVKHLLTSPHLPIHADIHYDNDMAIHNATENGGEQILDYLLTSPELKEHINIIPHLDEIFENCLANLYIEKENSYEQGSYDQYGNKNMVYNVDIEDTLNYLIYDYCISPTDKIIELLKDKTESNYYEPAIKQLNSNLLFNTLSTKVNQEVPLNIILTKKTKI